MAERASNALHEQMQGTVFTFHSFSKGTESACMIHSRNAANTVMSSSSSGFALTGDLRY